MEFPRLPVELWFMIHPFAPPYNFHLLLMAVPDLGRKSLADYDYVKKYYRDNTINHKEKDDDFTIYNQTVFGLKNGLEIMSNRDDSVVLKCRWKLGKLDGNYWSWDIKASISIDCNYYNGILQGKYYKRRDGIITKATYYNGKIEGILVKGIGDYHENHIAIIKYRNNLKHGTSIKSFPKGDLRKKVLYEYGQKIGIEQVYHRKPHVLRASRSYIRGKRHGPCCKYFPDGELSVQKNYIHGVRQDEGYLKWSRFGNHPLLSTLMNEVD